jgi:hypothetical protein
MQGLAGTPAKLGSFANEERALLIVALGKHREMQGLAGTPRQARPYPSQASTLQGACAGTTVIGGGEELQVTAIATRPACLARK